MPICMKFYCLIKINKFTDLININNLNKNMLKYLLLLSIFSFAQKQSIFHLSNLNNKQLSYLFTSKKDIEDKKIIASFFLNKAKKEKNEYNIILGYLYLSQVEKNEELVVNYFNNAIYNSKKILETYLLSYSYYSKANHFINKRKYSIALNNYLLANKNLNKKDNELLHHDIQFSIAIINSSLLNYKEALPVFLENHNYYLKLYKRPDLNAVYAIAESYNRLGNIKLAIHYTNYGKNWSKKLGSSSILFISADGINHFKEKKYIKAIDLLKKSLPMIKEDFANYATNSFYIAKSYLALKKKNKAIVFFKKVDSIFEKENNITIERIESYKYLIDYYKEKKDINNQLYYTNNLIKADSTLRTNYQYLTKKIHRDYDIPKLLISKEALIKKLKNEKFYYILFVSLFAILMTVIIFLFRKKQKKILLSQSLAFEKYKEKMLNKEKHSEKEKLKKEDTIVIQNDIVDNIIMKLNAFEFENRFLNKECTLDKLAKELETNTSYLSKIINDKKGVTFPNYINNLRIEYAVSKLENDDLFRKYNMKGIANSVGFNNADSFSRAFKSHMNMRPTFFIENLKIK